MRSNRSLSSQKKGHSDDTKKQTKKNVSQQKKQANQRNVRDTSVKQSASQKKRQPQERQQKTKNVASRNKKTNQQNTKRSYNRQSPKRQSAQQKRKKQVNSSNRPTLRNTKAARPKTGGKPYYEINDFTFTPDGEIQYLVHQRGKESYLANSESIRYYRAIKNFWIRNSGVDKIKRKKIINRKGTLDPDKEEIENIDEDEDENEEEEEEEEEIIEEEEEEEEEEEVTEEEEEEEEIIEIIEEEEEEEETNDGTIINNNNNNNNNNSGRRGNQRWRNQQQQLGDQPDISSLNEQNVEIIGIIQKDPFIILAVQTEQNNIIQVTGYQAKKRFPYQLSKFYEQYIDFN